MTGLDADTIEEGFNATRYRSKTIHTAATASRKAALGRKSTRIVFSTRLSTEHALVIKNCSTEESHKLDQVGDTVILT